MGRHTTHLLQRVSPLARKLQKPSSYTTRLTQHQIIARKTRSGPALRSRLHSTNTNRFLFSRSQLSTICEEPEEESLHAESDVDASHELYRHPDTKRWVHPEEPQPGPSRRRGRSDDVDMLGWDDETTLVAMLQESASEADEEEQLLALVEQIRAPMAAQGASLKQYLKETLLPAYNSIKAAHGVLDDKVDLAFGAGLLTFDEVCKKVERIALRDEDELRTVHAESQRNMTHILEELEKAYSRRKELWITLEEDIDRCVTRANSSFDALSVDVEQTISQLEKKSKALDKGTSSSANQKMLRDLLEKL